MKKDDLKEFEGQYIGIGVAHKFISNGYFFYYGTLSKLMDDALILDNESEGKLVLRYDQILQLKTIPASGAGDVKD